MKNDAFNWLMSVLLLNALTWGASNAIADIVLHPGYLTGQFTIGDYNVQSVNISASGGGYGASKSVTGDSYTLTVEGGNWDYAVGATAYVRPLSGYYPYTYLNFNNRNLQVPVGATVINDYDFGPGTPDEIATIRFEVSITGDAYSNWYGYGYAVQNVSPDVGEKTYSQSYTNKSSSPTAAWDMPLVPNDNVRIYATVYVDNRNYSFWTSSNDLRYENIAPGETLVVPLNIEHAVVEPPPPPPPPEYDYGKVQVNVDLTLNEPEAFKRHYVYGYSGTYLYENPASHLFDPVRTGTYTYRVRSYFDDLRTYLQWPYTEGDPLNDQVTVTLNQTSILDLISDTGVLTGELTFSGTLADADLNRYFYANGASTFYDPVNGSVRQPTYGGYAYQYKYMGNADHSYRLFLQPGPWLPYRVNASASDSSQGYSQGFSLNLYDYSHYYNGSYYDFGEPAYIEPGVTLLDDRDYCTGSVVVGFRDETGNTLSSPRFNASGTQRTETGKNLLSASASAYSNIRDALQPEVELHAPPGDYTLSSIRFQAADDTNLTFPSFPITLECGVRKGVPISGKPEILVDHPPAYYLTNTDSVTVSGTASDDTGIAAMSINGTSIVFQLTGNPDNQVAFSEEIPLVDGTNLIVTTATDLDDNESFDERPIHVDRWLPSVTILTPADGAVFADPLATVPIGVLGSDQGYGFTLKLYFDGTLISEARGPGNLSTAENVTLNETIGPLSVGSHTILAEIADDAGNSASHSITISTNTFPVATDDLHSTPEDVPLDIAAPGVLGNDTDADGHSLSATLNTPTSHGMLVINPDGSFNYTPNLNYNGSDSFTYTVTDGFGGSATASVTLTVTPVNDPPVANDDSYNTDEDTQLTVAALTGVLVNDVDIEGDSLASTLVAGPTNGTVTMNADGSFIYTPDKDFNGLDSFTYTAGDAQLQSDVATVRIMVNPVNDPPVVNIDTVSQSVQYSDRIRTITISAVDIDSATLSITPNGLPGSLSTSGGCTGNGAGSNCEWTVIGQTLVGAGNYEISFAVSDGDFSPSVSTELIVVQEDASATFNDTNPASVRVASDGGNSIPFTMVVHVNETQPDQPVDLALPGDITLANVGMSLVPVGPGGTVTASNCVTDDSMPGIRTLTCTFNGVPVETYTVEVSINGDYYTGSAEDALTVYDPSLGFTTGGGWFYWPGTGEKTNFGYTMKYGKNGKNVKGSLLLIRHLPDGQKYRIKSNAMEGLAVGQDPSVPYGWASFSGKATYLEPGMLEAEGNHGFTVYAEDRNEPGSGNDRFWITTRAKDGTTLQAMSLPEPAPNTAQTIQGGNILAPH